MYTFNTPTEHSKHLAMPFGLTKTLAVFQHPINEVLRDMVGQFLFVYLDDIIYSHDLKFHNKHVRSVLIHLLQLFLKAERYEFHVSTMDWTKVSGVNEWPVSKDRKQLEILRVCKLLSRLCPKLQ